MYKQRRAQNWLSCTLKANRCTYSSELLPPLFFFHLNFFGIVIVPALLHYPLGETEGAQQRIKLIGLFIDLSGLYGCRRRMCQGGGGGALMKASSDMELCSAHHPATGSTGHRLHLHGATVSTAAFLPPQRSMLPHRWVDLAQHTKFSPLFWEAAGFWLSNITYNGGCLKETMMHSETSVHPHRNMWVLRQKHARRCAEGGFIHVVFVHPIYPGRSETRWC